MTSNVSPIGSDRPLSNPQGISPPLRGLNELLSAIQRLPLSHSLEKVQKIYADLHALIPTLGEAEMVQLCKTLSILNSCYSDQLKKEPAQLATDLGNWCLKTSKYDQAMTYFAIALSLEETKERHWLASITLILMLLDQAHRVTGDPVLFNTLLDKLFQFYRSEQKKVDLQILYDLATNILVGNIREDRFKKFASCSNHLRELWENPPPVQSFSTKKYRGALQTFRESFKSAEISKGCALPALQTLFEGFLEDAFAFLGPAPCGYDFRAMGSWARNEASPYSDLEYFILIEKKTHLTYFKILSKIIHLQFISLGETPYQGVPTFHALGHRVEYSRSGPSGFEIDNSSNPAIADSDLIGEPLKMAQLQTPQNEDCDYNPESSPRKSLMRSVSLASTGSSLFSAYQEGMGRILNENVRKRRARKIFENLKSKYEKGWKIRPHLQKEFDLKEQFIKPLNLLLEAIGLHFGIEEASLFEIISKLGEKKIFSISTVNWLLMIVDDIRKMRILLHTMYGEKKDETNIQQGTRLRRATLEGAYWLFLKPLYRHFYELSPGKEVDLPYEGFKDALKHSRSVIPHFIRWIFEYLVRNREMTLIDRVFQEGFCVCDQQIWVSHLVDFLRETKSPLTDYEERYQFFSSKLSNDDGSLWVQPFREPLRKSFLKELDKRGENGISSYLSQIPSLEGYRQAQAKDYKSFQADLHAITDPPESAHMRVKLQCPTFKGPRFLKQEVVDQLYKDGEFQNRYEGAVHVVGRVEGPNVPQLHFKLKPFQPLMEWAMYTLLFRLMGKASPPSELARLEIKGKNFPVLVSQTIQPFRGEKPKPLDQRHLTWRRLCDALTCPGNGFYNNEVIDGKGQIFRVSGDVQFVDLFCEKWGQNRVQFCSTLFCLEPNLPEDLQVIEEFCSLKPTMILWNWLEEDVKPRERAYLELFSSEERQKFFSPNFRNCFTPRIFLHEGILMNLLHRFYHLQNVLKKLIRKKETIYPTDILQGIITLGRDASKKSEVVERYQDATSLSPPTLRLEQATSIKRDRVSEVGLTLKPSFAKVPPFEEIEGGEFSAEKARKNFPTFTKEFYPEFESEIESHLDSYLEELRDSYERFTESKGERQYEELDFSNHSSLTPRELLPFLTPQLKVLDLSFCPGINAATLQEVARRAPNLEILDLSGTEIVEIAGGEGLEKKMSLRSIESCLLMPNLRILGAAHCKKLKTIRLNAPQLTALKARENPKLREIEIGYTAIFETQMDFTGSSQIQLKELSWLKQSSTDFLQALSQLLDLVSSHQKTSYWLQYLYNFFEKTKLPETTAFSNTQWVSFEGCVLREKELVLIARILKKTSARYLNFSHTSLGDSEATFIAEEIVANRDHLEKLDLSKNSIGNQGALAIVKALQQIYLLRERTMPALDLERGFHFDFEIATHYKIRKQYFFSIVNLLDNEIGKERKEVLNNLAKRNFELHIIL